MAESSSPSIPALPGLAVETVEWLPSGAESGLVRVRGRWTEDAARQPELPVLALRAAGAEHRFDSLPDARFSRDPASWRGTYLVPAALVASDPEALWLEWASGTRSGLQALSRGVEPPPVPARPEPVVEDTGGEVIDRAVLAERRARRAEASEQQQARVAAEALKAVEVLELRSAELERRLEEATAERAALVARESEADDRRGALSAALASAAELRSRSREWQLRMRTTEMTHAGDAVRLAVLEAEKATTAPALRAALDEAQAEAAAARAAMSEADGRFGEARAAWDRRRAELEAELTSVRAALDEARGLEAVVAEAEVRATSAETRLQVETMARTTLEDELDRERAARAADRTGEDLRAARAEADRLRADLETTTANAATARARADALAAERSEAVARADALAAQQSEAVARADALAAERSDAVARADNLAADLELARRESASARSASDDLRAELELARSAAAAARAAVEELRAELEAERAARRAEGTTLQERIAELERTGREQLQRLAQEQAAAAAARAPAEDSTRMVADLDAAAEALRSRTPEPVAPDAEPVSQETPWPDAEPAVAWSAPDEEPAAPDAEPVVEWSEIVESEREPVEPGVEPRRDGEDAPDVEWASPEYTHDDEVLEPPAPDAEPYVEWTPPETQTVTSPAEPEPVAPPAEPEPVAAPAAPRIISATGPPARGLILGTDRRSYPLLRGAIVKLAHDNAHLAGRVLAALLPAQGTVIEGPLAYDLTISGVGTYSVAIAGGRAFVEPINYPRGRRDAEFHLTADPLILAELLAGVDHRIGRFFGPAKARGRKRRVKALQPLQQGTPTLADAARAGAQLDPELVYRTFAYAVHPSQTKGHSFTVAQTIDGDPPETWYLTAGDGTGLTVSANRPADDPAATVTMSRTTFDRLLRDDLVPSGERPAIRGDAGAVALMHSWTEEAR